MFCILVKLPSPPIPYPCVERIELCRGGPDKACWGGEGLWQSWCREPGSGGAERRLQGRPEGHWQESYRQITTKAEQVLKMIQMFTLLKITKWAFTTETFSCQHLSLSKKLKSVSSCNLL